MNNAESVRQFQPSTGRPRCH